jgi:WD40 repeat protein
VSNHNRHFRNLHELQNFEIDTHQIWIVRISPSGKYLATGGKSGLLKIYQILNFNPDNYKNSYSPDEIFNYMNFVNETPMRIYNDHSNDIIDVCWSPKVRALS